MDWSQNRLFRMLIKVGPILLVIITFISVLVALIFHAVTIDNFQYSHPPLNYQNNVTIGDSPERLMWFLQVSTIFGSLAFYLDE